MTFSGRVSLHSHTFESTNRIQNILVGSDEISISAIILHNFCEIHGLDGGIRLPRNLCSVFEIMIITTAKKKTTSSNYRVHLGNKNPACALQNGTEEMKVSVF